MTTREYHVALDVFGGPLDLLLYLVRKNEVDILRLPVAKIAAQFVDFLEVLEFLDLEAAAEFVATASALLEIKSRAVLPQSDAAEEAEAPLDEEPRSDLIKKLLDYKRLRDASKALEEQAALWQERYPRLSDERPDVERDLAADRIREVELWDLVSALARILRRSVVERETSVRNQDTPLSVYIERVGERVRREGRVAFTALFEGATQRTQIVSTFLAILELLRHHGFHAEQPTDYGEIWVSPPTGESDGAGSSLHGPHDAAGDVHEEQQT